MGIDIHVKTLPHFSGLEFPQYQTHGASGLDLCAAVEMPVTLEPGQREQIPTGMILGIPHGYEIQIRPRSGLALKHGIILPNSPGTIDSDYRGELKIIMMNLGQEPFTVTRGLRIAQAVAAEVIKMKLVPADTLTETCRGSGGFGHTGTH